MRDCNSSVTPGKFDTLEGILLIVKSDTDGTSGEGLKETVSNNPKKNAKYICRGYKDSPSLA